MLNIRDVECKRLVELAKNGNNEATKELIRRHSGLFNSIVEVVFKKVFLRPIKEEFQDDKYLVFWKAILNFDPDKDCKFSSWLGNVTRWSALDKIKSHFKRSKIIKSIHAVCPKNQDASESLVESIVFNSAAPDSKQADFVEELEKEEEKTLILKLIEEIPKKKEKKVVKLRLFDDNNRTWEEIAKEAGYCRQQAMNVFNKQIKTINKKYQNYA